MVEKVISVHVINAQTEEYLHLNFKIHRKSNITPESYFKTAGPESSTLTLSILAQFCHQNSCQHIDTVYFATVLSPKQLPAH
jgi:hypothetical protein